MRNYSLTRKDEKLLLTTRGYSFDTHRYCRRCNTIKSTLAFARLGNDLRRYCRVCARTPVTTVEVTEKQCRRCRFVKPINQFYRKTDAMDGHQSMCIHCADHNGRHRQAIYRSTQPRPLKWKQCTKCKTTKPVDQFTRNARSADHLSTRCIPCTAAYRAEAGVLARMSGYMARQISDPIWTYTPAQIALTNAYRQSTINDPCTYCGLTKPRMAWIVDLWRSLSVI